MFPLVVGDDVVGGHQSLLALFDLPVHKVGVLVESADRYGPLEILDGCYPGESVPASVFRVLVVFHYAHKCLRVHFGRGFARFHDLFVDRSLELFVVHLDPPNKFFREYKNTFTVF